MKDHSLGVVEPFLLRSRQGIRVTAGSFLILLATAGIQVVLAFFSGSVGLLADTLHNLGDAATAVPLWLAFTAARWKPSKRFTYGYSRVEDLAGVAIVLVIFVSALGAGYGSLARLLYPQPVTHLGAVMAGAVIGFLGNEIVAVIRTRSGREIGSSALVAEGHHARADALTSLSVLAGGIGVWAGYPLADALVGVLITFLILRIGWGSGKVVLTRLLDGIDPEMIDEIQDAALRTRGVNGVTEVRVRWLGHRLHAEVNIAVRPELSVEEGHEIAKEVRHQLLHQLSYLSNATIHVDPEHLSGEEHHRIPEHAHDSFPGHSH